jgi:hypothetical protein
MQRDRGFDYLEFTVLCYLSIRMWAPINGLIRLALSGSGLRFEPVLGGTPYRSGQASRRTELIVGGSGTSLEFTESR